MIEFDYNDNAILIKDTELGDEWRVAQPSEVIHEIVRLQEKCEELGYDKNTWYRMAELHCQTIERQKHAMREAMYLLDQPEPRPHAAFSELLLALNPNLASAKRLEARQKSCDSHPR